jgi:hypothetical protein
VIIIFDSPYDPNGGQIEYTGGVFPDSTSWGDVINGYKIPTNAPGITDEQRQVAASPWFDALYVVGLQRRLADPTDFFVPGDVFEIPVNVYPYTDTDRFTFTTRESGSLTQAEQKELFEKVNVFPNPLYGYNPATSYTNDPADEPFVTFSNLPEEVNIRIYSLSGILLRTLTTADKTSPSSPFLRWDLQNENGLRVASGLYLAIVSAPGYGEKILKFSIIMPQKQIQRF